MAQRQHVDIMSACPGSPIAHIQRILIDIGEPATPPRIAPARAPPDWLEADFDQTYPNESEEAEPAPEFEFDQTVSW